MVLAGCVPEWSKGADSRSAAEMLTGSNPVAAKTKNKTKISVSSVQRIVPVAQLVSASCL